jgi:hypothetical protein
VVFSVMFEPRMLMEKEKAGVVETPAFEKDPPE